MISAGVSDMLIGIGFIAFLILMVLGLRGSKQDSLPPPVHDPRQDTYTAHRDA